MKKFLNLIMVILFVCSCVHKNKIAPENIAATINDSQVISLIEVDSFVAQKIYDELNEIYYYRKVALERLMREKLLILEAAKCNVTKQQFIETKIRKRLTTENIQLFIEKNHLNHGIPILKSNHLKSVKFESQEGPLIYKQTYYEYLYKKLTDSLMTVYKIDIKLKPPQSPLIDMSGVKSYFRGKQDSKITFWEVSDLECNVCKEISPKYFKLYQKYKDKVRFAYVPYSSDVNTGLILSEYANKNNSFWSFHDSVFNSNYSLRLKDYKRILNNIGIYYDDLTFEKSLNDSLLINEFKNNINLLNEKGFFGTPTILINGKLVDPFDIEEIEKEIQSYF